MPLHPRTIWPVLVTGFLLIASVVSAQDAGESGASLTDRQVAYDARHYDLRIEVFPAEQRIEGRLAARVRAVAVLDAVELDLHDALEVTGAWQGEAEAEFVRSSGKVRVQLQRNVPVGEEVTVTLAYGGKPHTARNPPWDGGFTWKTTPSGAPWIATSCQTNGADLWWPCKDHPSDEPESMTITVTTPKDLVCATNGRLIDEKVEDGKRTVHYGVSTPINTYCVALNIAPYVVLKSEHTSVTGEKFPVRFFALPEHREQAEAFVTSEVIPQLRWFEESFGPYPFRADKYGVVETPHLGMEHQTIIAYGNRFRIEDGYDWLHHHELAHEWWGNLVSVRDWKDFWIHEGVGTYTQALYQEHLHGMEGYHRQMGRTRRTIANRFPVAPRESAGAKEMSSGAGLDIYYKGAWVMHTLRWLIGREALMKGLASFCYPTEEAWKSTDGSACRGVDTEEFLATMETASGQKLDWFFEVYLRQPKLPRLERELSEGRLTLRWVVPNDLPFPMPVAVQMGEEVLRVPMSGGRGEVAVPPGVTPEIDPEHWILRDRLRRPRGG